MPELEFGIIGESLNVGSKTFWDNISGCLYYVDVPSSYIYKYIPSANVIRKAKVGDKPLAFALPVQDTPDQFIAGIGKQIVIFNWDDLKGIINIVKVICEVEPENPMNCLSTGKIDPAGRLWVGTMGPPDEQGHIIPKAGSVYCLDGQENLLLRLDNCGVPSGLAWDTIGDIMYMTDAMLPKIFQFDFNRKTGELQNQKEIYNFVDEVISIPSGLCVDCRGNLWVCMIYGAKVLNINPRTGQLLTYLRLQTPQVTDLSWGDCDLRTLYVNTARKEIRGKCPEFPAGCLFRIKNIYCKGCPSKFYLK